MLANRFKTADELEIYETQRQALIKVLALMESGKLVHKSPPAPDGGQGMKDGKYSGFFNMDAWRVNGNCGTVACIGGTAELVSGVNMMECPGDDMPSTLSDLFHPGFSLMWEDITPGQAAIALRSYLTTGDAHWDLVLPEE